MLIQLTAKLSYSLAKSLYILVTGDFLLSTTLSYIGKDSK